MEIVFMLGALFVVLTLTGYIKLGKKRR